MTPSTSLSAIDAVTSVSGPIGEEGLEVVEGDRQCGGAGGVVGAVEQHVAAIQPEELEAPGPDGGRVADPPGDGRCAGDPCCVERIEQRIGDGRVRRLVPAAQSDPRRPQPGQVDVDAVAIPAEQRSRDGLRERHAQSPCSPPDDRQAVAAGAGDRQVAALDDRRLLAGDRGDRGSQAVGVIEVDVGDHGDAAVPGMRRVKPASEAHLHERDVRSDLGEAGEDDRGQQLELGRFAVPASDGVADPQHAPRQPAEVVRIDRPAIDLDPFPVRHEVGLGRRPDAIPGGAQRRVGEREDASLPVRPRDEGSTGRSFRVAERRRAGHASDPGPGARRIGRAPRAPGPPPGRSDRTA